jgi:hypothetical protein
MKLFIYTFPVLLLLSGCQDKPAIAKPPASVVDTLPTPKTTPETMAPPDSATIRAFAEKVLNGSEKVTDNQLTSACMGQIFSDDPATRDYYWKVFEIILRDSDGALSESVDGTMVNYLEEFPDEFARRYTLLTKQLQSACVMHAAFESYMDEKSEQDIKVYYKDLMKGCGVAQKKILDGFCKKVIVEAKRMAED